MYTANSIPQNKINITLMIEEKIKIIIFDQIQYAFDFQEMVCKLVQQLNDKKDK